ncbi:ABC transporter ATP-binding protein [Anaerococcus marasmi]|uniref:ATP-binding cassette domain-containing protein n=1 Tax=Anaerococcus marasmi TaxID=2057797 RepID=UPI000CF9719D|nr:ABC transporter ATP-binding protein [Anaerococcus marasmi]
MRIRADKITKAFDEKRVLDNISFDLEEGMITGLVGRNGSGKTTLLKCLCGIYDMDEGSFSLDDKDIRENPSLIKNIAFLPDSFDYFNYYKVKNIPGFFKVIYEDFDETFFLEEIKRQKIDPDKNVRNFSKGQKNILGLITILASRARILLIDEILDGMDVLNKKEILSYLIDAKDSGKAVFASSHELDQLSGISDYIFYLTKDGKLIDTSDEKINQLRKIQLVFKDQVPDNLDRGMILVNKIGRVATILVNQSEKEVEEILNRKDIVQYDILTPKIEDYFYLERGREDA